MAFRSLLLIILIASLSFAAGAQDDVRLRLPELGSSADALISPQEAARYGAAMLHQMRALHKVLDDPQVNQYLNDVGYRLVAASADPKQKFTFFVVRDSEINAFAAPGGYIGVNAGLITLTRNESELAAVMAHEIGHISQHHLERAFEASKKDAPLMALVLLGAIAAGSTTRNGGDAGMAVLAGGQGLLAQKKLNFTRADEAEADRVGIQTLAQAGYDPEAMADFFQRMEDTLRPGSGGISVPALLQTHPVTAERISDARARARVLEKEMAKHPVLPMDQQQLEDITAPLAFVKDPTQLVPHQGNGDPPDHSFSQFTLMRERVRVLTGDDNQLLGYYAKNFPRKDFDTAYNHYGYALDLIETGQPGKALGQLKPLLEHHPQSMALRLAMAQALFQNGQRKAAFARYAKMHDDAPDNHAVTQAYAGALTQAGSRAQAGKAEAMLRPLLDDSEDPDLYQNYARASEEAGKPVRAGEAFAYASYLSGRPFDAMQQFRRLLNRHGLDYYQRARIQSHIAELTPLLMELRKRHVDTPDHHESSDSSDLGQDGVTQSGLCLAKSCS
ncbi:M48 family metalloprotease [Oleiagrimonas sp.]|jgi:predicted Zn-dependent protease|uniref:beta-barrel assembly-enhancing protease n=1 Tax=Oleiagrimonas sp. TaxID=2010330 RepID=UPI00260DD523|nr:M48 family metalloprotease [Oleiagrimonas sp.]MDA3912695.1 M48 family metalloprotease [Oleiagrimonas sp.]